MVTLDMTPDRIDVIFPPSAYCASLLVALVSEIDTEGLELCPCATPVAQIESRILESRAALTLIEPWQYALLQNRLTRIKAGGIVLHGDGPWVVTREPVLPRALAGRTVAIAGESSLAMALWRELWGDGFVFEICETDQQVCRAVADGAAEAGALSPEARPLADGLGLTQLAGLGALWREKSGRTTLPIGLFACSNATLSTPQMTRLVQRALDHAFTHQERYLNYLKPKLAPGKLTGETVAEHSEAGSFAEILQYTYQRMQSHGLIDQIPEQ